MYRINGRKVLPSMAIASPPASIMLSASNAPSTMKIGLLAVFNACRLNGIFSPGVLSYFLPSFAPLIFRAVYRVLLTGIIKASRIPKQGRTIVGHPALNYMEKWFFRGWQIETFIPFGYNTRETVLIFRKHLNGGLPQ